MALDYIYDKDFTAGILLAFNNNVIRYKSSTSGVTQVKSEITTNGFTYTIYPDLNGWFWFNFKSVKSVELNVDNYADTINPNVLGSYVYDWSSKAMLSETIQFKIYLSTGVVETSARSVTWFNAYANLIDYKKNYPLYNFAINTLFVLKQLPLVKYWAGYPFDISIYNYSTTNFNLKNNSNGINYTFTTGYKVPRLFFSDGRTDVSIEDVIPFNDGFNNVTASSSAGSANFLVEKITSSCNGHYLKWMNSFGGWNYWLFNKGNENISTKELGSLNNDFNNLADTISPYLSLGTESSNSISFIQENITEDEMFILRDLLDSVKVFLFTGTPFTKAENTDWIEVSLKSGTFRISNSREKLNTLSLAIDIPINVNRKI
jgi:hypothetical protein